MTLRQDTTYPSRRTYVLKLSSDAAPDAWVGRLENVVTGRQRAFESVHGLIQVLNDELAAHGATTGTNT